MVSQKNHLDKDYLLDLQKRSAKALKKSLGWETEKMKRDQILSQCLNELKVKTIRKKRKEFKAG